MSKRTLPTKLPTAAEHELNLPRSEVNRYNNAPLDNEPGRSHKPARAGANFDEKVYLFPESYNALREEMMNYHPILWANVQWYMAFDSITFVEKMDYYLDTKTTYDTQTVDGICKKYLDLLRNQRGISGLHSTGEKA